MNALAYVRVYLSYSVEQSWGRGVTPSSRIDEKERALPEPFFVRFFFFLCCLRPQDGKRMDHDSSMLLMRKLVKLGCEPRAVGYMSGGASPMDPIFWVLHQIFEKALHVLWMSPTWRDSYSFEWVNGTCQGSGLDDELPFSGANFRRTRARPG